MAFEKKTFQDSACAEDTIAVSEEFGRVVLESVVVYDHKTEDAIIEVSPKRARKIALAILAAADEAEGLAHGQDTEGVTLALKDDPEGAVLIEPNGPEGEVCLTVDDKAWNGWACVALGRKEAREAALAMLRVARRTG